MIRELLIPSIVNYGGNTKLVDRLLVHGNKQYLVWVLHQIVDTKDVYTSLYMLSEMFNIPITKLRYAYFSAVFKSHGELSRLPEYKLVMDIVNGIYNCPELWRSLERYCFKQMKRLCIEELTARDETALTIMDKLKLSNGLVYEVRSEYIKRELNEKSKI